MIHPLYPLLDLLILLLMFLLVMVPLPVTGRGILGISSFHVLDVAHVPRLTMQLISGGQIVDFGCRVILDFHYCSILDRHSDALLGAGPRHHDSQGLWEFDWLHLPSVASLPPLLPCLPALFNSGIFALVTCVALVFHP